MRKRSLVEGRSLRDAQTAKLQFGMQDKIGRRRLEKRRRSEWRYVKACWSWFAGAKNPCAL
jgi:hypothetical protein